MINIENFLLTLPIMGYGMLGIFVVTLLIIGCVAVFNRATSGKK